MFEQYPKASYLYEDLIEFTHTLTPEEHKGFAGFFFPKYMKNDGVDFIFHDIITRKKFIWFKQKHTGIYRFKTGVPFPLILEKICVFNDGLSLLTYRVAEILEYINTLSSSDVEKLKKLVDDAGTIYPLLEVYFSEWEYINTLAQNEIGRDTIYCILFIRDNLNKPINFYWLYPESRVRSWSPAMRFCLGLPIIDVIDMVKNATSTDKYNNLVACDLVINYYLKERGNVNLDFFYGVKTEPITDEASDYGMDSQTMKMIFGSLKSLL